MTKYLPYCEDCNTSMDNFFIEMLHRIRCHNIKLKEVGNGKLPKTSGDRYNEYLESTMVSKNMMAGRIAITENSHCFIILCNLDKGKTGKIVRVKCPRTKIITVRGNNQTFKDNSAYILRLQLADDKGIELDLDTKLRIYLSSISNSIIDLTYPGGVTYRDMKKGYMFEKGIILNFMNNLDIEVVNPDTDIFLGRTIFYLEADILSCNEDKKHIVATV